MSLLDHHHVVLSMPPIFKYFFTAITFLYWHGQPLYSALLKRNAKAKIINEIINTIKEIGGRFLAQNGDGGWEEITDKK